MKKIISIIILLLVFPIIINSIYSEKTIDELLESAKIMGEQGMFSEAITEYEKILKVDPNNPDANNSKGAMLLLLDRYDEAEFFIDKALESDPENVSALSNKGIILQEKDQIELALITFEKALKIEPDNIQTLFNKANVLKSLDKDKSLEVYDEIFRIDPYNKKALDEKTNLLETLGEIRVNGYIQLAIRNQDGQLIGYIESDMIVMKDTSMISELLANHAQQMNEVTIDNDKYINYISNYLLPSSLPETPSKSGTTMWAAITGPHEEMIRFEYLVARTHGYMTEEGDVMENLIQIFLPK